MPSAQETSGRLREGGGIRNHGNRVGGQRTAKPETSCFDAQQLGSTPPATSAMDSRSSLLGTRSQETWPLAASQEGGHRKKAALPAAAARAGDHQLFLIASPPPFMRHGKLLPPAAVVTNKLAVDLDPKTRGGETSSFSLSLSVSTSATRPLAPVELLCFCWRLAGGRMEAQGCGAGEGNRLEIMIQSCAGDTPCFKPSSCIGLGGRWQL